MAIVCDANKLPKEIKAKAHEYIEKRSPRFKTFGVTRDDVECAWLNGFAFCIEGIVEVKAKQCATCVYADSPCTLSDYEKDDKGVCNHYKNVLVENSELKLKLEALEGQTPWKDIKDKSELIKENTELKDIIRNTKAVDESFALQTMQLTKAKSLLKRCYDHYIYLEPLRSEIEQFLMESE